MHEVRATLDARYSDPDAEATPWSTTQRALESAQIAWLSTVRTDGRPHVTPLVPVWLGEVMHFCTGPEEQKAINLSANPHVVLTIGCDHWDRGLDVVVEGTAHRVTDRATLEQLAAAWTAKWDGSWRFAVDEEGFRHPPTTEPDGSPQPGGLAVVYAVTSTKIVAFGKGSFSQTGYRIGDRLLNVRPARRGSGR